MSTPNALAHQEGGDHYRALAIQPIEYILANGIGFAEGNVIKYVTRWRAKGGTADLRKARHVIDLLLQHEGDPVMDPAAPPTKRAPIAAQEIAAHLRDSDIYDLEGTPEPWAFREGVLYAEAIHGIRDDMPVKRGHPPTTHQPA